MSIRFAVTLDRCSLLAMQAVGVRAASVLDVLPCHASVIRSSKRIGRPPAAYLWRS